VSATLDQLASALYGLSGIPQEWIDEIVEKDRVISMVDTLFKMVPKERD
jgi:ADP-ribosyl-[dinitrogen reductase] hydrolase